MTVNAGPSDEVARLAVVIPAYNAEAWMARQLDALLPQVGTGDEIVVADNGSTDRTGAIVREYAVCHPQIRCVSATNRRGPSHARNVGVAATTAPTILFCDADDVVAPHWAERLSLALLDFDVAAGAPEGSSPTLGIRYRFRPAAASNNLGVRRHAHETIGGFDEELRIGEDVDYCWRAIDAGLRIGVAPGAEIFARPRAALSTLWEQEFQYGKADVALYERYRSSGMPAPRTRRLVLRYGATIVTCWRLLGSRRQRRKWVQHCAKNVGRLTGSVQRRVWYP